jgi:hypothetical protein
VRCCVALAGAAAIDARDAWCPAACIAAMHMGRGNQPKFTFKIKNNYYSNNLLEWIPMAHIDARDLPAPFVHGCLIVWYT